MRSLAALFFVIGASVTACSLFTDLGGFGGDTDEQPPVDAAAPDAPTPPSADAPPGDSAPRFCEGTAHALCADFESGQLLDGWTGTDVDPQGTLEISTARAAGGARSLFASLIRQPDHNIVKRVFLEKRFAGPWRRTVIDLDMFLEPFDWQNGDISLAILSLAMYSNNGSQGIYLSVGEGFANITTSTGQDAQGRGLATNRWVHLHWDVTPDDKVEADVDGQGYYVDLPVVGGSGDPRMTLSLGINAYNDPSAAYRVYYDNVTVDFP